MSKLPKYKDVIGEAILALNEKGGSSSIAIIKYSKAKHGKEVQEKRLRGQLKKMVKDGHLEQVKNSFKLTNPKEYQKKKSFVKKGGMATKPKKLLSGKKLTGAADIIKKLNENKNEPAETKEPVKPASKKKESTKKASVKKESTKKGSTKKASTKKSTSAKKSATKKSSSKTKATKGSKAKSAPKASKTKKGSVKGKPKPSEVKQEKVKKEKVEKKKAKAPSKTKIVKKPSKAGSKQKASAKAARGKKVAASGKGSQKK